ncbi:MAG: CapA family protein [Dehalococcoidia bacterium]
MPGAPETDAPPAALLLRFTFPIDDVSLTQAQQVLSGKVVNWSELGGPDLPIELLGSDGNDVVTVNALDFSSLPPRPSEALLAAVAGHPGSLALVQWDGPYLHTKGLSINGWRPDEAGYPLQIERPAGQRATPTNRTVAIDSSRSDSRVSVAAGGDLMLGRRVSLAADGQALDYPLNLLGPDLADVDIGLANLEVALTQGGEAVRKDYTFRAAPALAAGLRRSGITLVSLANNHVLDFGPVGLANTIAALDQAGVKHSGAGKDEESAATPAIFTIRGTRLAILSFVNVPNDSITGFIASSMSAGPGYPGVNWGTVEAVQRQVSAARLQADSVIVTLHAGDEYAEQPNQVQRSLAHTAIDAGAALVIGAHPHVLQGIEYYRDGLILYSLGNLVFDLDRDDVSHLGIAAAQTVIARLVFKDGRVDGLDLRPAVIDSAQYRPVPASGSAARSVLDRIYRLTDALAASH